LTLAATEDESRDTRARKIAEFIQEARGYPWVGLYDVLEDEIVAIAWTGDVAPAGSTRTELVVSVLDPASKEVVGTIAVESDRVDAFDHQDVELIEACARAAARVWER
jgi:putative methionine-R-sulfoxide reductase with GAF domain